MIAMNGLELHMFDSELLDEQLDEQLNYSLRTRDVPMRDVLLKPVSRRDVHEQKQKKRKETEKEDGNEKEKENGNENENENENEREKEKEKKILDSLTSGELEEIGECLKNKDVLRRLKMEASYETLNEASRIENLATEFKIVGKWMVTKEGSRTVLDRKDLVEKVFEAMHQDLGHYGKDTTVKEIKARFLVAKDLLDYGLEMLDSCIPCQLFKRDNNTPVTASLHHVSMFTCCDQSKRFSLLPHSLRYSSSTKSSPSFSSLSLPASGHSGSFSFLADTYRPSSATVISHGCLQNESRRLPRPILLLSTSPPECASIQIVTETTVQILLHLLSLRTLQPSRKMLLDN